MKKEYLLQKKKVTVEYEMPYSIEPDASYRSRKVILSKNGEEIFKIERPDFVIQVGENEFVYTECHNSIEKDREVFFVHASSIEKDYKFLSTIKRKIKAFQNFPLTRIESKFLIPSDNCNVGISIYDAQDKFFLTNLLQMNEDLQISKIVHENTEFFKILDRVTLGTDVYGQKEYEELTALLAANERIPNFVCNSKNQLFPLQSKKDFYLLRSYIAQLQQEYRMKQVLKNEMQEEGIKILLKQKESKKIF